MVDRPLNCVAVSAPICVAVKFWISVDVNTPICAVVRLAICDASSPAIWVSERLVDGGRRQPGDLRRRDLVDIDQVERVGRERAQLRRGQALHLGGAERADLRARKQPERRGGEAAELLRPSAHWPASS